MLLKEYSDLNVCLYKKVLKVNRDCFSDVRRIYTEGSKLNIDRLYQKLTHY